MHQLSQNILLASRRLLHVRNQLFASVFKKYEDIHSKRMAQLTNFAPHEKQIVSFLFKFNEQDLNSQKIDISNLYFKSLPDTAGLKTNVPTLKHGLDNYMNGAIVQKDIGVKIPQQVTPQFLESISSYVKPSQDTLLKDFSLQSKIKYIGSTSSVSSPLSHLYYVLSLFRRPSFQNLLQDSLDAKIYMISARKPISFVLKPLPNGQYAIDGSAKLFKFSNEVLLENGIILQYLLTTPKEKIQQQLEDKISKTNFGKPQYYRYGIVNDNIFLRSQIDCRGKNANGQDVVFEIKSRACAPIRYDVRNYINYLDYPINSKLGKFESYERQYYDLIRGSFLKYAIQLRIGQMDGAFLAYHNTRDIYGYQYISAQQIYKRLFGSQFNMQLSFLVSCKALTNILDVITSQFKGCQDNLKIGFYAACASKSVVVFVEQMSIDKQYEAISVQPDKMDTVTQYFDKIQPLRNPVYKYEFYFYLYHNGEMVRNSQVIFEPTDDIQLRWKYQKFNRASLVDYKGFLHDEEKLEWTLGVFRYNGMWSKNNDE